MAEFVFLQYLQNLRTVAPQISLCFSIFRDSANAEHGPSSGFADQVGSALVSMWTLIRIQI
jgi:hypothetical protein